MGEQSILDYPTRQKRMETHVLTHGMPEIIDCDLSFVMIFGITSNISMSFFNVNSDNSIIRRRTKRNGLAAKKQAGNLGRYSKLRQRSGQ